MCGRIAIDGGDDYLKVAGNFSDMDSIVFNPEKDSHIVPKWYKFKEGPDDWSTDSQNSKTTPNDAS